MTAGGIAHDADALRVDAQLASTPLEELDRGAYVVQRLGEGLLPGLRKPVADRKDGVAAAREVRSQYW